jgi:hypothetical protein
MLANGVVGGWHIQFFQLPKVHPPEVMASKGFEGAFLNLTTIDQKKDRISWIGIEDRVKNHSHLRLDIQFLL